MKKKNILIILAIIMAICCAIGIFQWANQNSKNEQKSIANTSVIATESEENQITQQAEKDSSQSEKISNGKITNQSSSKKPKDDNKASSSAKGSTSKVQNTTAKKMEQKSSTKTNTKATTKATTTENKSISVNISITCKNIDHADILSNTTVTASKGDNAFDVTKKICQSNSIRLTYQSVYYVQGIDGVMEKDYGKTSGWMYRVNGTAPNTSAYNYKLKDGDTLEWYYVTSPSDK